MRSHESCLVDNRDAHEMYGYLEARIEILKRRIRELEQENEALKQTLPSESSSPLMLKQSAV